jgi:hypothetical protein
MTFDYYTYHISGSYLSALINGDYSGLSDEETANFDRFMDNLPPVEGHFDVIDNSDSFRTCDICNLYADTYETRLYFSEFIE